MIGKKINQLATELAPASTDLTIIGNPTTGVSKKITLAQLGAIFSGAVSFYTNLASFPATGTLDVIFCAKDTQKLYLWSGSAYVEVFPSQALLDTYQLRSEKGVSNGYASLDSSGKVPISQLPSSIMEYKGTWNAATNTPTLANGTGDTGDVYICNVAGTVDFGAGPITFAVGDYVIYSGTIWQRSSGAVGTVTSVAASITGNAIGITGSPVTTSGTLAFAFAGTGTQYIKGDGTLATFPSTIAQAERLITEVYNSTGATLTKGTIVYINGGQGNLPTVTKALATGDSTSAQTFGVVQADITNNNNGYVVVAGKLSDLDTQAYTEGTQLYLSSTTAGTWTSTKQYAPAHLVYVGIVVRSHPTQGIVEIKIQNGYELDEIHNVAAQTPTNNDGLFWESATSLWKNKSIATVLGYTPQPQLSGTGFVKISGTTISYDNSTYLTTSAASSTYLPLVLNGSANTVDINGQQFTIQGSAGGYTSGRIIVDPVFSAIGYQNAGVFDGLKILTNGNAEFTNSGVTRFFNQVRFDSTLTDGTYTYTLPGATGTIALVGGAGVGTVTSVGLSSATSGVTIGSTPVTTSGTITLAIATASGSQQGLLSSTDWTTFNNKQNALTNPVTGTGTTNYLPKFTGTSTIGNSVIQEASSNIGIGVSPSYKLEVYDSSTDAVAFFNSASANGGHIRIAASGNVKSFIGSAAGFITSGGVDDLGLRAVGSIRFATNGAGTDMLLDASGNLGLGVTPSAWGSGYTALQIKNSGFMSNDGNLWIYANGYFDGSSNRYIQNGYASRYYQYAGAHYWDQAISGTAGNAIGFTQAMTLSNSGNLSIGNTNDTYKLDVSGTGRFTGNVDIGTGDSRLTIGNTSLANTEAKVRLRTGSTKIAWEIGGQSFVDNALTITPSTAAGGTTFTTPVLTIASTGAATFSSSVQVGGIISTSGTGLNSSVRIANTTASTGKDWHLYSLNNGNFGLYNNTDGLYSFIATPSGNVGIGTTSPYANLDLGASGANNIILRNTGNAYNLGYIGNASGKINIGFSNSNSSLDPLPYLTVTSGSNVGIGTTSPSQKLEVAGVIRGEAVNVYGSTDPASTSPYLFSPSTGTLGIGANGSERMRINNDGSFGFNSTGIGSRSYFFRGLSGRVLVIEAAESTGVHSLYLRPNASGRHLISSNYLSGGVYLPLSLSGRENDADLVLATNGNVGIGTSSPDVALHIYKTPSTNDAAVYNLVLQDPSAVASRIGSGISFGGFYDATNTTLTFANIKGFKENTTSGDYAGALAFTTRVNGGNPTERMRITSGGQVCINQTVGVGAESLEITSKISGSAQYGILVTGSPASYTNYAMRFHYSGVAIVGSITFNTTSTSYNTSSDYRLKTDYKDFSGLDLVSKIKAYDYEWKSDKSRCYGVIAHELQSVINYAVTGVKDGKEMQGVDYSKIVPVLIKAIQELNDKIK